MPKPLEICLEDLDLPPEDERYLRCVALPGGEPGLCLDREGAVRWMPAEGTAAHGLWISADDKLMLLRHAEAGPVSVQRGGRSLQAPAAQPVVLLDGDLLALGGRRLQVHVHGVAEEIHPPDPISGPALARLARSAAAALALGLSVTAAGPAGAQPGSDASGSAPIEVRARPPAPPPRPTRKVDCTVTRTSTTKDSKWPMKLHATCPTGEKLSVGLWGQLLDKKGQPVPSRNMAQIKQVKGARIVAAVPAKLKGKAAIIRFRLPKRPPLPDL